MKNKSGEEKQREKTKMNEEAKEKKGENKENKG